MASAGVTLTVEIPGAACRTYNLLLAEDRRVAAALLPPALFIDEIHELIQADGLTEKDACSGKVGRFFGNPGKDRDGYGLEPLTGLDHRSGRLAIEVLTQRRVRIKRAHFSHNIETLARVKQQIDLAHSRAITGMSVYSFSLVDAIPNAWAQLAAGPFRYPAIRLNRSSGH